VDVVDVANTVRLNQLLQSVGYIQNVSEPTHDAGHTLDLVISRRDVQVTDLFVGDMISDHALICFKVQELKSSVADVQTVTSRAWRRLSRDAFASDLMETGCVLTWMY